MPLYPTMVFLLVVGCVAAAENLTANQNQIEMDDSREGRIVGGSYANIADLSYQASVQMKFNNQYRHFCGGAIVSPDRIVSAAHCFFE